MGLSIVQFDSSGNIAEHDADLFDIKRRLREGDPTVGWRGDPTARIFLYKPLGRYLVILDDAEGTPYVATSSDRLDHRLIANLVASDPQRGIDRHAEIEAHNRRVEADGTRRLAEQFTEDVAPALRWHAKRRGELD